MLDHLSVTPPSPGSHIIKREICAELRDDRRQRASARLSHLAHLIHEQLQILRIAPSLHRYDIDQFLQLRRALRRSQQVRHVLRHFFAHAPVGTVQILRQHHSVNQVLVQRHLVQAAENQQTHLRRWRLQQQLEERVDLLGEEFAEIHDHRRDLLAR